MKKVILLNIALFTYLVCFSQTTNNRNNIEKGVQTDINRGASLNKNNETDNQYSFPVENDNPIIEFNITSQVDSLKNSIDSLRLQLADQNIDNRIKDFEETHKAFRILIYATLGIIFLLIFSCYYLLFILTSKKRIINFFKAEKSLTDKFIMTDNYQHNSYSTKSSKYPANLKLSKDDHRAILDNLLNESRALIKAEISKEFQVTNNNNRESIKTNYKYLKGKTGRFFNREDINSENSFFRLFDEKDDYAFFEFFGDEAEAIANRIFTDDVCTIISGNYQNARQVITNKEGKIKRNGDQWEVIEPVQIKLV